MGAAAFRAAVFRAIALSGQSHHRGNRTIRAITLSGQSHCQGNHKDCPYFCVTGLFDAVSPETAKYGFNLRKVFLPMPLTLVMSSTFVNGCLVR